MLGPGGGRIKSSSYCYKKSFCSHQDWESNNEMTWPSTGMKIPLEVRGGFENWILVDWLSQWLLPLPRQGGAMCSLTRSPAVSNPSSARPTPVTSRISLARPPRSQALFLLELSCECKTSVLQRKGFSCAWSGNGPGARRVSPGQRMSLRMFSLFCPAQRRNSNYRRRRQPGQMHDSSTGAPPAN